MSQADDILFAPIGEADKSHFDFLIRVNAYGSYRYLYDWKPVSERAVKWCETYWSHAWRRALLGDHWMMPFTTHPGPVTDTRSMAWSEPWNMELINNNFQFGLV